MKVLILLGSFLFLCSSSSSLAGRGRVFLGRKAKGVPVMPNINYAFRGYHLLRGNPLSIDHEADPGFNNDIFKPIYSGFVTEDLRYQIPDGFLAYQKPICNIDFTTKSFGNEKVYHDELKNNVNADFGGWGAAFTANTEYKKDSHEMTVQQNQFVKTDALCSVYEVDLDTYNPPNISQGFKNAIKTLEYGDYDAYLKFVNNYGTHFLHRTHMGAKYSEQMELSKESKETLEREGIDIDVAGSYSTLLHLKIDVDTSYNQEAVEKFNNEVKNRKVVSYGSRPPTDGSAISWTNSLFDEPLPISYGLLRIQELFSEPVMGSLNIDYTKIREKLEGFLEGYCEAEKSNLGIKSCNGPSGGCAGGHSCHHNAHCSDVEVEVEGEMTTSYECNCNKDFVGDGFQCSGWKIQDDINHDLYPSDEGPGDWHEVDMCPEGTYAHAFALKVETIVPSNIFNDDTGLNGVKLYCKSFDGKVTGEITSGVGDFGSWKSIQSCQNDNEFFEGFRFNSEGPFNGDGIYGGNVDMQCGGGQIIEGNGESWSSWSSWTFCPKNARICGIQTQIEKPQGSTWPWDDDTGLDNLKFVCCEI